MDGGEGHFIARMRKKGDAPRVRMRTLPSMKADAYAQAFLKDQLQEPDAYLYTQGTQVYARTQPFVLLEPLKVVRQGILCGESVKKRFEPHQHFYMASVHQLHLLHVHDMDQRECEQFLKGHPIASSQRGFLCMRYQGFPLGFGKGDGTWVKNRYPKGMRIGEQVRLC